MGKILLNIGILGWGLVAVILALAAEELLTASARIGGLLLAELAKSLNWIAEGEFEDMELILSVFGLLVFTGVSAWDGVTMRVELVANTSMSKWEIYCCMGIGKMGW